MRRVFKIKTIIKKAKELKTMEKNKSIEKIEKETPTMITHAEQMTILTVGDIDPAKDILIEVKNRRKTISDFMNPICDAANKTHKLATSRRGGLLDPLDKVTKILNDKISDFLVLEEEKAEKERQKAEAKRLKDEQAERERIEKQAEKAIDKGDTEKAEFLMEEAETVFIPPVEAAPIQTTFKSNNGGGSMSAPKDFSIEVFDLDLLLNAIIDEKMTPEAVKIEPGVIKKYIKMMKIDAKKAETLGVRIRKKHRTIIRS